MSYGIYLQTIEDIHVEGEDHREELIECCVNRMVDKIPKPGFELPQ